MTDQAAFLRAIVEHPFDRLTRLVYADWLDEHDDGRNGFAARAEFIRLQCDDQPGVPGNGARKAQARKLFATHCKTWWPDETVLMGVKTWQMWPGVHGVGLVRNGFVEAVRCPLSGWIGPASRWADATNASRTPRWEIGVYHSGTTQAESRAYVMTPVGIPVLGQDPLNLTANGLMTVTQHPVTRLIVSDRAPAILWQHGGSGYGWRSISAGDRRDELPWEIAVLPELSLPLENGSFIARLFKTHADAVTALGRALINWARKLAGLSTIQWEVGQ